MRTKKMLLSAVVLTATTAVILAARVREKENDGSGTEMIAAAQRFLQTLNEDQRDRATFDYDSPERLNWHYIPRQRKGVPLRELEGEARRAAHSLLAAGLSNIGYEQALNVMSLEEVLYLLEKGDRQARRNRRDPEKYYFSIFGRPSSSGTWGWRCEGHHLSLNFSITDGQVVASTPEFFGANPARIDAGPGRSIRVLGPEEDIARQILKLCSPEQQRLAWIDKKAPDDIRGGGEPQPPTTEPVGLPVSKMSADQKMLMGQLLNEYLQNMPADVEKDRRKRIEQAGIGKVYFAWWGSDKPNERHHYRVQGPTFLIEYNNTQNNANHLHTVWRNLAGDFNIPLKKSR